MNIHSTAVVHPGAELAPGVKIGPYAVINEDVVIGPDTEIMAHAYIDRFTRIGEGCRIFHAAALGGEPQDLKFKGEKSEVIIGDRVVVREFVTVNRGTAEGGGRTVVGNDCLLMAYVHVAHDCRVGDRVVLANNLAMAGHVTIEEGAYIGGMVAIHQFATVGAHAYIGGFSRVSRDVPPYLLGEGAVDFRLHGPNSIGLKRKGYAPETIRALKEAFKMIFRNRRPLAEVLDEAATAFPLVPEVHNLVEFIRNSQRGVDRFPSAEK
ncbi:MAG: acyl-ACP--UDP-N-acetylglucosamine O-acyltransferase [Pseudomonadota bacterium]